MILFVIFLKPTTLLQITPIKLIQYLLLFLLTFYLNACSSQQPVSVRTLWDKKSNSSYNQSNHYPHYKKSLNPRFYQVKKKDTLYGIAWRYHLNYQSLAQWNSIHPPYTIKVNQVLRLIPPIKKITLKKPKQTTYLPKVIKKTKINNKYNQPKIVQHQSKIKTVNKPQYNYSKRGWLWPTQGKIVKKYNSKDEFKGIHLRGKIAQPILSTKKGKVVYSGNGLRGYGKLIIVKHENDYLSAYGFNKKRLVKEGDTVEKGQQIATMGLFKGIPILHFEIRLDGKPLDPLKLLP